MVAGGVPWRERAIGFWSARRLDRLRPARAESLIRFDVRKMLFPIRERHSHALYLVVIFPAAGARGQVVFDLAPFRFRQNAARQEADAFAVALAPVQKPFHIGLSAFSSATFIF